MIDEDLDYQRRAGRFVYEFEVEANQPVIRISFDGVPDGIGSTRLEVGLRDGPSLSLRQFVFP